MQVGVEHLDLWVLGIREYAVEKTDVQEKVAGNPGGKTGRNFEVCLLLCVVSTCDRVCVCIFIASIGAHVTEQFALTWTWTRK